MHQSSKTVFFLVFLCQSLLGLAQTQSPQQFFGFATGDNFSRHHEVVEYIRHVADKNPNQVKVIPYGYTNERRPLMIVAVGSAENIARLEQIRLNHLRSIGLGDGQPVSGKLVPISWLSYNVHGNESVSTNTVPLVLHELLDKNNAASQKILANSLVILDPCINPDGYDRYTNWYNQKKGSNPNANPEATEHREPWPGGRFNHYLFDLNRDWAWELQKESQQRMALYRQWMPHLHADFHEQGVEQPYYFAPAAKPYHEDITTWQREFQGILGDYNKRDFDKNSWLYFSRERFDLLYPSYGDTYPTYNGAFGMTYEQGGSGRAGLAIAKRDGDTLTLAQRIAHHKSTSFAAMEAVADRSERVTSEFVKFFDNAQKNPNGAYKSFIIKGKGAETRLKELAAYLKNQEFKFGYADKAATALGYGFQEQKDVTFGIEKGDMVISLYQPRSVLLKILFEPKTMVEDSVTYDITSWNLAYAYGLKAYGIKSKVEPATQTIESQPTITGKDIEKPYAYLARWSSFTDLKLLANLLKKGIKVRSTAIPFEIDNQSFATGTLVILRTGNERMGANFDKTVRETAAKLGVSLVPVSSGFVSKGSDFGSDNVSYLKAPKIACMAGDGVSPTSFGEVWHFFDEQIQYPISIINVESFGSVDWKNYDVLILTDGSYGKMLNEKNLETLKNWIKAGGKLVAMESAVESFAGKDGFDIKHKDANDKDAKATQKVFANREREAVSEETPGSIYKVSLDNTHPLAFGYDSTYMGLILGATDYQYLKEGWNVGVLKDNDYVTGFAGKNAKEKLKNSLIFGVQEMGRGSVVYLANNPIFRGFWQNGKLLFGNAVFVVGN
jgi:hypothetical protein